MSSVTVRARIGRVAIFVMGVFIALPALTAPAEAETPTTCSNTTLILDESGSVDPHEETIRSSVHAFLDTLSGTGTATSLVEFGSSATTVMGYTEISPTNITDLFDPYLDATAAGHVYDAPSQMGAYTNWDDALDEVSAVNAAGPVAPVVLFLTDGDPTAYNLDQGAESGGVAISGVTEEAVQRAVEEADAVSAQGSHIIAIGVGTALSNASSIDRLQQVAGPDVYDGSGPFDLASTDVVLVPEFTDLPEAMSLIAQAMCADPAISVEKKVSQAAVIPGTTVDYEITVTNTGNVPLDDVVLDDPSIPECSQSIGTLAVGESVTVTCSATVWAPLTNVATATGEDPFGTPVTDDGSAQTALLASGTGTPGFWKNHSEVWPILDGLLVGDWNHNWTCDTGETCLSLSEEEAMAALSNPPKGDMTWNLGRALVAAWLNVSAGNDSSCIADVIDSSVAWLTAHPMGTGVSGGDDAWGVASEWAKILDDYNNGLLCAEHRDAGEANDSATGTSPETSPTEPTTQADPPANEPAPPPQAPAKGLRSDDEHPSDDRGKKPEKNGT